MRPLSVVVALLSCSCVRNPPTEKAIGYGGAAMALVAAVVLGIVAECQSHPELRDRYDRFCGYLLLIALCGALVA